MGSSVMTYLLVEDDDTAHEWQIEEEASHHAYDELSKRAGNHLVLEHVASSSHR